MSREGQPDEAATATAEEVLRTIYGDDLKGCTVSLETIGKIIQDGYQMRGSTELLDLYDKLVEAIHLLSTPPDPAKVSDPGQLQALLGERLDAIHGLTKKTIETTAPFRSSRK